MILATVCTVLVFHTETVFQFASQYSLQELLPLGNPSLFTAPPRGCRRKPYGQNFTAFLSRPRQYLIVLADFFFSRNFVLLCVNHFGPNKCSETFEYHIHSSRSQWPCGLKRRSVAERLLGSWVRVAWMFVSCECLCCQVQVSATGRSLVQSSPTDCGVCLSVIKWK
jgi:hypothetical protein